MRNCLPIIKSDIVANVPYENIIYILQSLEETTVVTTGRLLVFTGRLKDIAPVLDDRFYQCHRSYIINLDHVDALKDRRLYMSNGDSIYLCKSLYLRARKTYIDYITGGI